LPESNAGESVPVESERPDSVALSDETMFVGQKPGELALDASGVKEAMNGLNLIEVPPPLVAEPATDGPLALFQ
jgi:hypothetical protein